MLRYGDFWINALITSSNCNGSINKGFIYGLLLVHCYAWTNNVFKLIIIVLKKTNEMVKLTNKIVNILKWVKTGGQNT